MISFPEGSDKVGKSKFRALAIVLLCQLPIMIVVECGVALNGFLLAEVLVLSLDAVNCSTGDLPVISEAFSSGREDGDDLLTVWAPRGVEHDQGVLLLLQGLPEIVLGQMQHIGLLLLPGGLWQRDGLGVVHPVDKILLRPECGY